MSDNYAEWKSWNEADFGQCTRDDASYFRKLLSGLQRQAPALDKPGALVLEIGFGNGSFLRFARDRGMQVTGVDIVPELVDRARKQGYAAYASVGALLADQPATPFDGVFLFDVLEHLSEEQIRELLAQLAQCTGAGSVVALRFPNGGGPLGLANQHGDPTHQTALTASKLEFFLQGSAWQLQSCRGDVFAVWNGRLGKWPHRAMALLLRGLIEKLFRLIYFPQSRGVLSANLLAVLRKR